MGNFKEYDLVFKEQGFKGVYELIERGINKIEAVCVYIEWNTARRAEGFIANVNGTFYCDYCGEELSFTQQHPTTWSKEPVCKRCYYECLMFLPERAQNWFARHSRLESIAGRVAYAAVVWADKHRGI